MWNSYCGMMHTGDICRVVDRGLGMSDVNCCTGVEGTNALFAGSFFLTD